MSNLFRRSDLVLKLQDAMSEGGVQVRVGHLLDAERVEHLVVRGGLQALKFVDGLLTVVNDNEVDELLVIVDIYVHLLDGGRVRVDILAHLRLGLEETLQSRLAQGHFLQLCLLVSLLGFGFGHEDLLVAAALHRIHHGLDVEQLVPQLHVGIFEWVPPFFNVFRDFRGKVLCHGMRQDAFGTVTITVRVNRHVFKSHHIQVDLFVVLMGQIIIDGKSAERFDLFL